MRLLRTWSDRPELPTQQQGRDWAKISASNMRAYLAESKPAPRRNHRLVSSRRNFWSFLRDIQRLPGALALTDVARLLDAVWQDRSPARGERNWCVVAFLYGTGLRIPEMLELKFDQIGYHDGYPIAVRVMGKGDKERRVPLSETARSALTRWSEVAAGAWPPGQPVGVVSRGRRTLRPADAAAQYGGHAGCRCPPRRAGRD